MLYSITMHACVNCGAPVKRKVARYCSNKCQGDFEYKQFIEQWKQGNILGGCGIHAKTLSGHVRRYMLCNYGRACSICGWDQINTTTKRVPLEIDHIDGDSDNNTESNLRMICPNCHALTPNFRGLNRGHGRAWRREKYIKVEYKLPP
jgi:hypothetical protein